MTYYHQRSPQQMLPCLWKSWGFDTQDLSVSKFAESRYYQHTDGPTFSLCNQNPAMKLPAEFTSLLGCLQRSLTVLPGFGVQTQLQVTAADFVT